MYIIFEMKNEHIKYYSQFMLFIYFIKTVLFW